MIPICNGLDHRLIYFTFTQQLDYCKVGGISVINIEKYFYIPPLLNQISLYILQFHD